MIQLSCLQTELYYFWGSFAYKHTSIWRLWDNSDEV